MKRRKNSLFSLGAAPLVAGVTLFSAAEVMAQTATDLVCNKCVQASDIATGAVTNAKIAGNAVNNSKIANGAVNAAKLAANSVNNNKIANGAVTQGKFTNAAVTAAKIGPGAATTEKIANAAVTAAKIGPGAVTGSKIADGAVITAKLADGAVTGDKLNVAHVVFVEDSGDALANCTALLDALTGLTGPATVLLGPGNYDCGANSVELVSGISLVGAGANLTTLEGTLDGLTGLVRFNGDEITLADMTVINDGDGDPTGEYVALDIAAAGVDARNWLIRNAALIVRNGNSTQALHINGSDCDGGELINTTVTASGSSTVNTIVDFCAAGTVRASNVSVTATTGRALFKSSSTIFTFVNSSLSGPQNSVLHQSGTTRLVSSELDGTLSGAMTCIGAFDENGAALSDGVFGSGGCI